MHRTFHEFSSSLHAYNHVIRKSNTHTTTGNKKTHLYTPDLLNYYRWVFLLAFLRYRSQGAIHGTFFTGDLHGEWTGNIFGWLKLKIPLALGGFLSFWIWARLFSLTFKGGVCLFLLGKGTGFSWGSKSLSFDFIGVMGEREVMYEKGVVILLSRSRWVNGQCDCICQEVNIWFLVSLIGVLVIWLESIFCLLPGNQGLSSFDTRSTLVHWYHFFMLVYIII